MVFSRLSAQEKEAFFGLLDEYFASRPEILGSASPAAAAAAVGRLANSPYAPSVAALAGHARAPSEVDKLVANKTSVFAALKKGAPAAAVAIPPAFGAPKNTYGPPPARRGAASEQAPPPEGEWAEVLYDYKSEDPGDLEIDAGARVLVTAKSSEDWWTGRIQGQGKEGLFPASYVKLL